MHVLSRLQALGLNNFARVLDGLIHVLSCIQASLVSLERLVSGTASKRQFTVFWLMPVYDCWIEAQGASGWPHETTQTCAFLLPLPQSSSSYLSLPITPIGIVAFVCTLLWDNLWGNSAVYVVIWSVTHWRDLLSSIEELHNDYVVNMQSRLRTKACPLNTRVERLSVLYCVIKLFQITPKRLFWNGVVVAVVTLELLFQACK